MNGTSRPPRALRAGPGRRGRPARRLAALPVAAALVLAGCTAQDDAEPTGSSTTTAAPTATETAPASEHYAATGAVEVLATGLETPWSIVLLADGTALISERDTGAVLERAADGTMRTVGTVPDVYAAGEGGLLGLAIDPDDEDVLYAYTTTASDNRVLRIALTGAAGARTLGQATPILTGLPRAQNHNGGRIAFGPDGMLYVAVGDAGDTAAAQDPQSVAGSILRITADGQVPADNPFPGSAVYSYGHRNVQGLGWQADGTMWASEFGQDTWDELNRIVAGGNYGWPVVEGIAGDAAYIDPVVQWATDDASPSGIAVVGDTVFVAALAGERLWTVQLAADGTAAATDVFAGAYGRIRDVVQVSDDTLWLITNNTDGRGVPAADDDKLIAVTIAPTT